MKTIELPTRIVILQLFRPDTSSPSCLCDARRQAGILYVYFYAKHEHGTGIAGVSQFLFLNLTSALICLYPCYIKDYLWLDELWTFQPLVEMRIPIAPEPVPEKPVKKKLPLEHPFLKDATCCRIIISFAIVFFDRQEYDVKETKKYDGHNTKLLCLNSFHKTLKEGSL